MNNYTKLIGNIKSCIKKEENKYDPNKKTNKRKKKEHNKINEKCIVESVIREIIVIKFNTLIIFHIKGKCKSKEHERGKSKKNNLFM